VAEFCWLEMLREREPGEVVLIAPGRRWCAAELADEVAAFATRLSAGNDADPAAGAPRRPVSESQAPPRVLAVLADNSPAWVMADLACQVAGVVHLPLPDFFSVEQLRHTLENAGADQVLTDRPERITALGLDFVQCGKWQGLHWLQRVAEPLPLPAGTAKISFTSGSTGAPKGVCLSAAGLRDTAVALHDRLADIALGSHLAVLPLALLLENVAGVYAPLLHGMPVHLQPLESVGWRGMAGFDPAALDRSVRAAGAGSVILVPELLKAWTMYAANSPAHSPGANTLRFVAVGGARVAPELLRAARTGGIPAYQGYGLTEAGSVVALNRPGDDGDGVGRGLPHVQLSLVDGELRVTSRAFLGYVGGPPPLGGFATGDLASFDARGHLQLAGRRKNLLITSFGRNVSPEWIEAELLADPCFLQGVVIGDGQPALAAIVVPHEGITLPAINHAIKKLNSSLPDYARIAHCVISKPFTSANGLATGNGRPRRSRIIAHHADAIAAFHEPEVSHHAVL